MLDSTKPEQNYRWKNILKLIKKFIDIIDTIPDFNTNVGNIISEVMTISLEKTLGAIQKHFLRIEKREKLATTFRSFRSFSTENNYVDLRTVVWDTMEMPQHENASIKQNLAARTG